MGSLNEQRVAASAEVQTIRATAASVAHGLNNLLGAMAGLATQLVDRAEAAPGTMPVDELRLLQQAAHDGVELTRRLLAVSRGAPIGEPAGLELVDLGRTLVDAVDLTRPSWQERSSQPGTTIEASVEVDRPLLVRGVPSDLHEIVVNLIHNAVDAMPNGGRLWLCGKLQSGTVVITCQDSGIGMSPAVLTRIFEPFYTTKGDHGTGLGLAIVSTVVARHGGEVRVASQVGVGTTVTLRLPAAEPAQRQNKSNGSDGTDGHQSQIDAWTAALVRDADGRNGTTAHPGAAARAATADDLTATLAPLAILIVEDDPVFRAVFARRLTLDARRVDTVSDAASALSALETGHWDILCIDDGLPDRSGRALADEIRQRGLPCATVLVTGTAAVPDDPTLAAPGVDAILPKPCTDVELARALRLAADRRAERAAAPA
jgi:CheY-like chemotaxis protein